VTAPWTGQYSDGKSLCEAFSRDQLGDDARFPGRQGEEIRKGVDTFGEHSLAINDDKASDRRLLAGGTPAERHDMHDERRRSVFIMNNEQPFLHRFISLLRSGSDKRLQFSRRRKIDCIDAVAFAAQAFARVHESFQPRHLHKQYADLLSRESNQSLHVPPRFPAIPVASSPR